MIKHYRKQSKGGPVKRSSKGRVCKKYGCRQRLSIYNLDKYCNVHRSEFTDLN